MTWYGLKLYINKFDKEYIDDTLREKWIKMIGFRNTLVHDYVEIDREIVFDILQNGIEDIERLERVFTKFL
ncbi:MAG: DUF86 domain-containing protein [Proteobacteria bacterium]|nr:DUF86 domain-containing protein [Pseudomonadota bacterium]